MLQAGHLAIHELAASAAHTLLLMYTGSFWSLRIRVRMGAIDSTTPAGQRDQLGNAHCPAMQAQQAY